MNKLKRTFRNLLCRKAEKNQKGGIITDPVKYLRNTLGTQDSCVAEKQKTIPWIRNLKCSGWEDKNNCTITAVFNIMTFYRDNGYLKIPDTDEAVYSSVRNQALRLGFDDNGISVTKNNDLVKKVWREGFGYASGNGRSKYLWTHSMLINELNHNRPFIFSLAKGAYFNHTVTVYGYVVYKNMRTGKKYTFLTVADGWSDQTRYMAFTNTNERYISCASFVVPPKER